MSKRKIFIVALCFFVSCVLFIPFTHAFDSISSDPVPWQEFKRIYGENWKVKWNEKTGTPHRVFGNKKPVPQRVKSLKRTGSADSLSESEFENIARLFIEQNNGLFKVNNSDLQLQRSKKHGPIYYVTFKQLYKSIPVYNGRVDFQFDTDGNLLLFGADVHPAINIAVLQKIKEESAVQIVKDDIKFNPAKDKILKSELLIYPEEIKEGFKYYLVWRLEVDIKEPIGNWIYIVDAGNGGIKLKFNDIKNNIGGKITGYILPRSFADAPQEVSFPYESVFAGSYTGVSDNNGIFSIPTTYGNYTLTTGLSGKYMKVINQNGSNASYSLSVSDGKYREIRWDTSLTSGKYDEMNVYYHSMKMRDYIKSIDPDFTGVDYCMSAVVGLTDPININSAFYDWGGVNFGAGDGSEYKSAALSADIIYHEYSHGVNTNLYSQEGGALPYIDGTESGAMEEGFASYWACSLIDDSKFGLGYYSKGAFWEVDNDLIFPNDLKDQVHDDGWIIAGAMWRLRKLLGQTKADYLFHFARYSLPTTFRDFILDVLMKNDDNNDLSDGTPNSLQIYTAFGLHGISGLHIKSISVDDSAEGNDNGKMNPGEILDLVVTLENKMFENAEDVNALLSTEDIYTEIISGQADFGDMPEENKVSRSFTIMIDDSVPIGNLVLFNLNISNKKGYTFDFPFHVSVSELAENKWRIDNITSIADFPNYASNSALERDKDGNLHLLFGYNSLSHAFYDGYKWAISVLDNTSLDPYNYSLAMVNNIPHLVFNHSDADLYYLKYAKLNNGQWETETMDSNDSSQYIYPALSFDSGNAPKISYAYNDHIVHSYKSGGKWLTEAIDAVHLGSNNSIGVASNTLVKVAYYDFYCEALKYAEKIGTQWVKVLLDKTPDTGKYVDLAIGPNGNPHLCYYDNTKGNLKYIYWDGYSWKSEIVDMDGDVGLYPSLAVDSKDLPYIVYYDKTNGALKCAHYNGNIWEITKIDDSDDAGYYPSVIIDDKGSLFVTYYSKSADGNTYLKFASSNFMSSPFYLQPVNNSLTDINVMLRWILVDIKEGDNIKYDVYLDTAGANTKIAENISESKCKVTNLEYGRVYYWRIIYRDQNRFEYKCAVRKFKTPLGGDVDRNGIIDGNDLVSFSNSFGSTEDFDQYNIISDIDHNGRVDGADLMLLGMNFGKSY